MERRWLRFYDEGVPRHLEYPAAPAHHLLANSAALWPDRICTNFMGRRLSYGRLEDLASRLAAGAAGAGLKPGDRVVLLLPNCPQFLIAAYGLWAAGAVLVPVNPLSSVRELHFFLSHTEASSVVTIPLFLRKAGEAAAGTAVKSVVLARLADYLPFPYNVLAGWGEGKRVRAPYLPPAIRLVEFSDLVSEPPGGALNESGEDVEAPAAILYSGGTTGTAKGVVLSHANLVANARQVAAWGHLEEGGVEKMLAVLPLFHGFGMSTHMNAPVLAGMEVILVPRFSAKGVARTIHKERPTFFCGVPAMFAALGSAPNLPRCDFSSLKGIFVGAAPLPPAVKQDFETRTGGRMIEGYGLTE
ncbi:MAG: AMP-binding protein, partial [Acidobacteriota bacterium]